MNGFATGARVLHVVLLALGIGAAAQLLTMSDALEATSLESSAEVRSIVRAQLDGFMVLSAPLLLLTLAVGWLPLQSQLRSRAIGVGVWALLAALSTRWLSPRLETLRAQLGRALDGLPPTAVGAADWVQLTAISRSLLVGQLVVGVILLLWAVTASGPKRTYGGIQL